LIKRVEEINHEQSISDGDNKGEKHSWAYYAMARAVEAMT